jgi:hypothetical protein
MHVQSFWHVNRTKEPVDKCLFVEDFMRDCELASLQTCKNVHNSNEVEDWCWSELVISVDVHDLEEEHPIEKSSKVQNKLEWEVIIFKGLSLLFVRIDPIHTKNLIEKWQKGVNDGDEGKRVVFDNKITEDDESGKRVVRKGAHQKWADGVEEDFFCWEESFDGLNHSGYEFYC